MKQVINLEAKDIRTIIAKFLGIPEEDVIPNRYSFSVSNMSADEIARRMEGKNG